MATVLQAATAAAAARSVRLALVADALVSDTSRVDAARQAYDAGLAAELGKWPSWIGFAETVGVKAADLNHTKEETAAFRAALDGIIDLIVRDAWQSPTVAKRVAEEKALRASGKVSDADAVAREIQSARTRRSELANVVRYGAIVGRYILDRMNQEGELASVHKATVWGGVFSACNKRAAAIREDGGVITADDLYSAAAAVLDGARKPERTDDEKRCAAVANLHKALGKASELNILNKAELGTIWAVLNRNPQTQQEATEVEASIKPAAKPAAKGKPAAKPATAAKPAAKPAAKVMAEATKIAADVI
jgi:hypothetical protein